MNYIRYAFIGIAIIISSIVIGYIITNERKVADLKLENQQIAISNETNKTSLELQKEVVKKATIVQDSKKQTETLLQKRLKKVKQESVANYTINDLIDMCNNTLTKFNNIENICTE